MSRSRLYSVLVHLHRNHPTDANGLPDTELLDRFLRLRDEASFELLVWRHERMVLGVCRRLLREEHDAVDAFQATFLTLARKASSIGQREAVASWLYKVAYRSALRLREVVRRQRQGVVSGVDPADVAAADAPPAVEQADLHELLDEEVQRLPAKYRAAVVLCYLEGRSNEEAAGEMSCPVGTVKTRLSRAREMLHKRLIRRKLALSTAAFSTALSVEALAAPLPPGLIDSACKAALDFAAGDAVSLGLVSAQAAALAKGVMHTMFVSKMKTVAMLVLALGLLVCGTGAFSYHLLARAPVPKKKTDNENIQGTWTAASAEADGRKAQPEVIKDVEVVITADKITINPKGENRSHNYKLDPTKSPKIIEITPVDGPAKGESERHIYELNGDQLKLCIQNGNKQPPTEFATKAGDGLRLLILKRAKK